MADPALAGTLLAVALTAVAVRIAHPSTATRVAALAAALVAIPAAAAALYPSIARAEEVTPLHLVIIVDYGEGMGSVILDPVQLLAIYLAVEIVQALRQRIKPRPAQQASTTDALPR